MLAATAAGVPPRRYPCRRVRQRRPAELQALAWAAMRRGVTEIAVAGVIGSVAYNATASLGVAALVRPLAVTGILAPAIAAAVLPAVLLAVTPGGRLTRPAGVLLLIGYAGWVTAVLIR